MPTERKVEEERCDVGADVNPKQTDAAKSPSQLAAAGGDDHSGGDTFQLVIEISVWKARVLIVTLVVLIMLLAAYTSLTILEPSHAGWRPDPQDFARMGPEVLVLFRQHDLDDDGVLSLEEFEPLAHVLVDVNTTVFYDSPISLDDNIVTIESHFIPLNISTMSIWDHVQLGIPERVKPLSGLRNWKEVAIPLKNYAVRHLASFWPDKTEDLGKSYHITPYGMDSERDVLVKYAHLSNNRYYPPRLTGDLIDLHQLLSMFHPRPFLHNRFPPQGALACLRAYNDDWFDISFRIHAEFQLNEPPGLPFWFTPAQFKGRLVISRTMKDLKFFHLYVPNSRRLNVDMEWLRGPAEHDMEVDIGYMPLMELRSTAASRPAQWDGRDLREALRPSTDENPHALLEDINWTKEVQVDVCERDMELRFYPFKAVPYYNYTEAFSLAAQQNKLVHSIVLWGALDDQSC